MRIAVAVAAVATLSVNSAAAQERGWLAIGKDSASHAFSFRGADDAVNACGFQDCEVVETFTACLAVVHSSETSSGTGVWTWTEAATEGDANRGARDECIESGGLACAVMNAYCADGGSAAAQQAQQAPAPATAEQENIFWQSIVNSTDPADFKAYLSQFPNGGFRALAEKRLAQLQAPACSEPAPLWCLPKWGALRLDPVIVMPTGRYTWDSEPQPGEIDPFGRGTVDLDVQLAGIEIAHVPVQNKFRYGLNLGFGIATYEDAGLMVTSVSGFAQVGDVYRLEIGWMWAKSGLIKRLEIERLKSMVQTADDPYDKTAVFVGVSFPIVSDKIRQLLGRLK